MPLAIIVAERCAQWERETNFSSNKKRQETEWCFFLSFSIKVKRQFCAQLHKRYNLIRKHRFCLACLCLLFIAVANARYLCMKIETNLFGKRLLLAACITPRFRRITQTRMYSSSKTKQNETPQFISIQIIIQKWNWYQSSWISVYFSLMI